MSIQKRNLLPLIVTLADTIKRGRYSIPAKLDERISLAIKTEEYYERMMLRTVRDRYEEKTSDLEFVLLFALLLGDQMRRAYMEGLSEIGIDELDAAMENELSQIEMEQQPYIANLLNDIITAIAIGAGWQAFASRMELWASRYREMRNRAVIKGAMKTNHLLMWEVGPTEHCDDCRGYKGKIKTAQEWQEIYLMRGHRPQSRELQCKGYRCQCMLRVIK